MTDMMCHLRSCDRRTCAIVYVVFIWGRHCDVWASMPRNIKWLSKSNELAKRSAMPGRLRLAPPAAGAKDRLVCRAGRNKNNYVIHRISTRKSGLAQGQTILLDSNSRFTERQDGYYRMENFSRQSLIGCREENTTQGPNTGSAL